MKNYTAPVLAVFVLHSPATFAADSKPAAPIERQGMIMPAPALLDEALKGDAKAQYDMGLAYAAGTGAMRDHRTAVIWLEKAARQNYVDAQYDLGMIYMFTEDESLRSPEKAGNWFMMAAEQGHLRAQNALAAAYAGGQAIEQSHEKALAWWRRAAAQKNAEAQFNIGYAYLAGEGVEANAAEAMRWLTLAAEQNNADAQYLLGRGYTEGAGVKANPEAALEWLHKAASQQHAAAMMLIGDAYIGGTGVAQSNTEAYYWYARAADIEPSFNDERDALRKQITPQDQIEVQKRLISR